MNAGAAGSSLCLSELLVDFVDEFAVSTLEEYADKVLPAGPQPVEGVLDLWPSEGIGTHFMTP